MLSLWSTPRVVDLARPADFDALEDIHAASFPAAWSADEQAALNEAPGVTTFVIRRGSATASRTPLGFITVRRAADEGEVLTMAVHPRQRKAGLGGMLLNAALKHLYAERVNAVFLEVDPSNTPALALYRKAGFKEVGERPSYYANGRGERQAALTLSLTMAQPAGVGIGGAQETQPS